MYGRRVPTDSPSFRPRRSHWRALAWIDNLTDREDLSRTTNLSIMIRSALDRNRACLRPMNDPIIQWRGPGSGATLIQDIYTTNQAAKGLATVLTESYDPIWVRTVFGLHHTTSNKRGKP